LPQAQELLTDAQRLGKLLFYAQSGLFSGAQQEILLAELKRQEDLFYSYAEAEAFDVPYHQVLDFYANTVSKRFHRIPADKIFGQEAAKKIEALSGEQVVEQVPGVLEKINAQQVRMHSSSTPPTPEDYLEYFKTEYKKRFYQFLLYRHTPIEQLIQRAASSTPN